ncbi:MAG TPA: methyltransferase domain-containing protein [Firmicutes bacterium]|jgi:SAM-dependent methyltransferase|nr:methyltransferase domain-containing protein [Bacillota bacterium]
MTIVVKSLQMAKRYISACVSEGEQVVDATCGNGRDTLFLAELVGEKGKVFSFDIQAEALSKTRRLLEANNLLSRVHLIQSGHEHIQDYVHGKIAAVMFNLGYLPGGDHKIVTRPDTTVAALSKSLQLLRTGGIVTIVVYSGHKGGREEKDTLLNYCSRLNQDQFTVLHYTIINQINEPPSLLVLERLL